MKFNSYFALVLGTVLFSFTGESRAAEPSVSGRVYSEECREYLRKGAQFQVSYSAQETHGASLSWGTRVYLKYGFGGYRFDERDGSLVQSMFDWRDVREVEMQSTAPYTWSTGFEATLEQRSSSEYRTDLDLVVRIVLPDGKEIYEKGGDSPFGYYMAEVPLYTAECTDANHPKSAILPRSFKLKAIRK